MGQFVVFGLSAAEETFLAHIEVETLEASVSRNFKISYFKRLEM